MKQQVLKDIAADTINKVLQLGADSADIVIAQGSSTNTGVRLGKTEDIEHSENQDLGLRVFVGKSQANVSTTDLRRDKLHNLAELAISMAKAAPEDIYAGISSKDDIATSFPELDLYDSTEVATEELLERAKESEDAAMSIEGITNSLGAGATSGSMGIVLVTSNGFEGYYKASHFSVSCSVLAGSGTNMERDYDYSTAVHLKDLQNPKTIGEMAANKAISRLNPKKIKSQSIPVVYAPRVARELLGCFSSAISGAAIARGTSFLKDLLNQQVFSSNINIIDDPHRQRGLKSKPFDAEGILGQKLKIVENGILKTWLLDFRSANKLGLKSTGHASRGVSTPPSPSATNMYIEPGIISPEELIADIKTGLYVTDLMGMGINNVTGDYSQGAAGFMIENGKITYPVNEITIASNMKNMFKNADVANDLQFLYGINSPTLKIATMTVAGT